MKTLRFEKVIYRNHKIVICKTISIWHDLTPRIAQVVCQNYFDGFREALSSDHRVLVHPLSMGYVIDSWNLHKDGNGWQYRFVNGRNQLVKFS